MKNFINKILNVPKLIRRIWLVLWILLAILLVMKFCFGIWYPIVIENENVIKFNDFVCNSWIRYLILSVFYIINLNVLYLTSCNKIKYSKWYELLIINVLIIISFGVKILSRQFSFITESLILIVIPIVYLIKKYKIFKARLILFPILIQIITMVWQLNIYLVRGINFDIASDNHIIVGIVLQLDYYIFTFITWIGVVYMSLFGAWFFANDITSLKAIREKELKKAKPNMKKIASLDSKIAELEKEGK